MFESEDVETHIEHYHSYSYIKSIWTINTVDKTVTKTYIDEILLQAHVKYTRFHSLKIWNHSQMRYIYMVLEHNILKRYIQSLLSRKAQVDCLINLHMCDNHPYVVTNIKVYVSGVNINSTLIEYVNSIGIPNNATATALYILHCYLHSQTFYESDHVEIIITYNHDFITSCWVNDTYMLPGKNDVYPVVREKSPPILIPKKQIKQIRSFY